MVTLIVYAHPNKRGHSGYFLENIKERFDNDKVKYDVLDLYKIGFNPVLKDDEHYTSGNKKISSDVKELQKKIKDCDNIIFIYPCFWNSMPAILKGFFDRVFTPKFAFEYRGKFPHGLLNKKALVFSSAAAPSFYSFMMMGNNFVKNVEKNILGFSGFKVKSLFVNSAKKLNNKQKDKIERVVEKGLGWLLG